MTGLSHTYTYTHSPPRASWVVLAVKNLPANAGDIGNVSSIPGLRRSLEKVMATHSSILAWRITWTEELSRTVHRFTKSHTRQKRLSMRILSQTPLPSRLPHNIKQSPICCRVRSLLVKHFKYSSVYISIWQP